MEMLIEVIRGSSGLVARNSVSRPSGSGPCRKARISPLRQKHSDTPTASTPRMMISRLRSSSRCPVELDRFVGRRPADAHGYRAPAADAGRGLRLEHAAVEDLDGSEAVPGPCSHLRCGGGHVVAADGILELADASAERLTDIGQALRAEDDQGDDQHDHELNGRDVRHAVATFRVGGTARARWSRPRAGRATPCLAGVRVVGVDPGVGRGALLNLVEVVEAARLLALGLRS